VPKFMYNPPKDSSKSKIKVLVHLSGCKPVDILTLYTGEVASGGRPLVEPIQVININDYNFRRIIVKLCTQLVSLCWKIPMGLISHLISWLVT
jgi:hypothetical protein